MSEHICRGKQRDNGKWIADHIYFGDSKREDSSGVKEDYSGIYGGYSEHLDPDASLQELTTDKGDLPF